MILHFIQYMVPWPQLGPMDGSHFGTRMLGQSLRPQNPWNSPSLAVLLIVQARFLLTLSATIGLVVMNTTTLKRKITSFSDPVLMILSPDKNKMLDSNIQYDLCSERNLNLLVISNITGASIKIQPLYI